MNINATLSISYNSGGAHGGVNIRIRDEASRTEFVDLTISHEEFSRALSALCERPVIKCEVRGIDNVGKTLEREIFTLWTEAQIPNQWSDGVKEAEDALIEASAEQGFAGDGWFISASPALNERDGQGVKDGRKWYRMSRKRYVDATHE